MAGVDLQYVLLRNRVGWTSVRPIGEFERQCQRCADDLDRRQQLARDRRGLASAGHSNQWLLWAQRLFERQCRCRATLNPILTRTDATLSGNFAGLTSNFAEQLLAIAKVIEARSSRGARRQVFLATLGSFDTHTDEVNRQQSLLASRRDSCRRRHCFGRTASRLSSKIRTGLRLRRPGRQNSHRLDAGLGPASGRSRSGRFCGHRPDSHNP